eukprot:361616-Chlamydomonas_euryale.AAC.23
MACTLETRVLSVEDIHSLPQQPVKLLLNTVASLRSMEVDARLATPAVRELQTAMRLAGHVHLQVRLTGIYWRRELQRLRRAFHGSVWTGG